MPAWPAYLLLFAAIPMLVPTVARRLGWRVAAPEAQPTGPRTIGIAAALLVVVPLVAVLALRPLGSQEAGPAVIQQVGGNILLTVVDRGIKVDVSRQEQTRVLTWHTPDYGPAVFYRIYRTDNPRGDTRCENSGGAGRCFLISNAIATTRSTRFVDPSHHRRTLSIGSASRPTISTIPREETCSSSAPRRAAEAPPAAARVRRAGRAAGPAGRSRRSGGTARSSSAGARG